MHGAQTILTVCSLECRNRTLVKVLKASRFGFEHVQNYTTCMLADDGLKSIGTDKQLSFWCSPKLGNLIGWTSSLACLWILRPAWFLLHVNGAFCPQRSLLFVAMISPKLHPGTYIASFRKCRHNGCWGDWQPRISKPGGHTLGDIDFTNRRLSMEWLAPFTLEKSFPCTAV